ncbi:MULTISPECIES: hypothetical protein [unclassified Moraxella]|uniref:hypothetical protein n=1 Tax=unclassified Moraxella TaxID=2685852 RepID=UPI003AF49D75
MKSLKNIAIVGLVASSAIAMTGCATNTGYGTTAQSGSARAAMNTAIAGAAIGALAKSDGNREDIGKAAAIGAAAGGATGYVLSTTPSYPYQK